MIEFLSFWPTTAEGWAGLGVLFFGFISAAIGCVGALIKLKGKGKELAKALKELIKHKDFAKIKEIATKAIEEAEATKKTGAEKKAMVIAAVVAGCREAGIELDDAVLEELSNHIEDMIGFFNDMQAIANKNKKK